MMTKTLRWISFGLSSALLTCGAAFGQSTNVMPAAVRVKSAEIKNVQKTVNTSGFATAIKDKDPIPFFGDKKKKQKFVEQLTAINTALLAIELEEYDKQVKVTDPQGAVPAKTVQLRKFVAQQQQRYGTKLKQNVSAVRSGMEQVRQINRTLREYRIEEAPLSSSIAKPNVKNFDWSQFAIQQPDVTIDTREAVLQDLVKTVGPLRIVDKHASTTVNIPVPDLCWWDVGGGISIPYPCLGWVGCEVGYTFSTGVNISQVNIRSTGIPFSGQADVQASASVCGIGPSASYKPNLNGELGAEWKTAEERISFNMHTLYVEVYVTIPFPDFIGGDYHLTLGYVDIAPYLPNPLYSRKVTLSETTQLTLPDGTPKTITIAPNNTALTPNDGYLRVTSDLGFN